MPSRRKNSHNDNMVILASYEALFDLLSGGDPHGQTLEERNMEKLDIIYGPGRDVNVKEVLKNDIHNG